MRIAQALLTITLPLHLTAAVPSTEGSIVFTKNRGQVSDQFQRPRPDVQYYGEQAGIAYHFTDDGVSYQINKASSWRPSDVFGDPATSGVDHFPDLIRSHRIDITWPGSDTRTSWIGADEKHGRTNYYLASCPSGVTDVRSYGEVIRKSIFPGIDVRYYTLHGVLKYDYLVSAGARIADIAIAFAGADVRLLPDGKVHLCTPINTIVEEAPVAFQDGKQLGCTWTLNNGVLGFHVTGNDPGRSLVIDPAVRLGATFVGDAASEEIHAIQPLNGSDLMIAGTCTGASTIATSGTFDNTFNASRDGFVARMQGHEDRLWGTYFGGSGIDNVYDMTQRTNDRSIVVGSTTSSSGIASAAALQNTLSGTRDAFVVMFDNSNGQRTYGTYFGGPGEDGAFGVIGDEDDNLMLVGSTASATGIATSGSFTTTLPLVPAGFLAKMDASGSLTWSTYVAGPMHGVDVDEQGRIAIAGGTTSTTDISTLGVHQTDYSVHEGTLTGDGCIMLFSPQGNRILGTYFGGNRTDLLRDIDFSPIDGCIIVCGTTTSSDLETLGFGAHTEDGLYQGDGLVGKFDLTGQRIWSRYVGGHESTTTAYSCAVDIGGNVFIAGDANGGWWADGDCVTTTDAFQLTTGAGGHSAYFTRLAPNGERIYGTYHSGEQQDYLYSIAVTTSGLVYIAGKTQSTDNIASSGAWDDTNQDDLSDDGFYAYFCTTPEVSIVSTDPTCFGSNDGTATAIPVDMGTSTQFDWTPQVTGSGASVTGLVAGITYQVTITTASGTCAGSDTATVMLSQPTPIQATVVSVDSIDCAGNATGAVDLEVTGGTPDYAYGWSNGFDQQDPGELAEGNYSVTITDAHGCEASIDVAIGAPEDLSITAEVTDEVSGNDGAIVLSVSGGAPGYTYDWSNDSTTADLTGLEGGVYTVHVTDQNGCEDSLQVQVGSSVGLADIGAGTRWSVAFDPSAQAIVILGVAQTARVDVMDACGRLMESHVTNGISMSIPTAHFASGIYLVRSHADPEAHIRRVLVYR